MPLLSRNPTDAPPTDLAVLLPAALLVLSSTLIRGGNRYAALMVIEWLAVAVLLVIGLKALLGERVDATGGGWRRVGVWALVLALPVIGLLQLLPLPAETWLGLPGRALYAPVVALDPGVRPLSLTPDNTALSLLAALPIAAAFLLPFSASEATTRRILRLWIAVAACQAALGLLQIGGFAALYFDERVKSGVMGSFANKNHFANFLMLLLPAVVLEAYGQESRRSGRSPRGGQPWLWTVLLFGLIAALMSSLSRAAIAIGLLTLLASAFLLPPRQRLRNGVFRALLATAALVALALVAGGLDWLDRFDASVLGADAAFRRLNRDLTWAAALDFWPLGAGLGSFATVFPRYQAEVFSYYFVEHAHSDFLQWLLETGLPGLLLAALALALVAARVAALARARATAGQWREGERISVAAGLGVLALALHAWVDFPLHIPANAMLGAFLLGAWLRTTPAGPSTGSNL